MANAVAEGKEPKAWYTIEGFTVRFVCDHLGLPVPDSLADKADVQLTGLMAALLNARPGCLYVIRANGNSGEEYVQEVYQEALRAWNEKHVLAFLAFKPVLDEEGNELPTIICNKPTEALISLLSIVRDRVTARVLALTGSVGKTSTKDMIRRVLQRGFSVEWSQGNANGFGQVIIMPQRISSGTEFFVQEVGMGKPQSVERATRILRPDFFVLTNIGLNHVKYFDGKQENILNEKLNIDRYAAPDAVGFVNWDDPLLRGAEYKHEIVRFGVDSEDVDFVAENVVERNGKVSFDIVDKRSNETTHVQLNVMGRHNVYNALAAFAVGRQVGIPDDQIVAGLASFRTRGVRQNLVWLAGQHVYLDCYNASEVAIQSAANTLGTIDVPEGGKRIFVVADIDDKLGSVTEEVHRRVGQALAKHDDIDMLIFFGEHMAWAAEEAIKGGHKNVLATTDRNQLEEYIRTNLKPIDLIGFKGGQQMLLSLTLDELFGTEYFLLDGDMTLKVAAAPVVSHGVQYRALKDYGTEVVKFDGASADDMREVNLETDVDGEPVRCVRSKAFLDSDITSVVLPEGVRSIGIRSFAGCASLEKVELPTTLRFIGERAFARCSSLKHVVIPEGVSTIDVGAFRMCTGLERIDLPASLRTLGNNVFVGCKRVKFTAPEGSYAQKRCIEMGLKPFGVSAQAKTGFTVKSNEDLSHKAKRFACGVYNKLTSKNSKISKSRPLVGIWRPDLTPPPLAKALAMMAPSQGIDLVYICTNGVDIENGCVHGRMLKHGTSQWEHVTTRIPDIIDSSSYCWKNEEARNYLDEHCWCTDMKVKRLPKGRLQTLLLKDDRVKKYAIPTVRFLRKADTVEQKIDKLVKFTKKHGDVVVKPVFSSRGRGVHRVTFDPETQMYHMGFLTTEIDVDESGYRSYAEEHFFSGKKHIVQKYVNSRSAADDPFDCRVHVEKNGKGEWVPASMLIRIGIGQKVISNVNQGGGMAELEPFLKANRPDNWEQIIKNLEELAQTVPYWYEEQRGIELCTLGIDTAITPEGDLHIFEINTLPFTDFNLGQVAMLRVCYYRFVARHRLGMTANSQAKTMCSQMEKLEPGGAQ